MPNQFQNMNLSRNSLNISHVHDLLLLQNFYGHQLPRRNVDGRLDLSKSAFAQSLAWILEADTYDIAAYGFGAGRVEGLRFGL